MYRARLPSKPSVEIAYSLFFTPATATSNPDFSSLQLIVFLNNLLMPASSWEVPITLLNQRRRALRPALPTEHGSQHSIPILTYDRFGQGATTDRDPLDSRSNVEQGYGHDFADVVADLRSLITLLAPQLYPSRTPHAGPDDIALLLVGASIGAPLARLYATTYPRTVAGTILLDSNIANANYSSFWPDPMAPNFDPDTVTAPDCSLEQYIEATHKLAAMFNLDVKNREALDRRNSPVLLPYAHRPQLRAPGPEGAAAKIMVVAHDPDAFADEGYETLRTPRSFTRRWLQTAWDRYNQGLLDIGNSNVFDGVRVAKGCGHFIQRDDPSFVANAIGEMLDALGW